MRKGIRMSLGPFRATRFHSAVIGGEEVTVIDEIEIPPSPRKPAEPTYAPGVPARWEWVLAFAVLAALAVGLIVLTWWGFDRG